MANTPPPGEDIYADQGTRLVASMITLIVLPTLFVIARLVSRKVSNAGYWWDDFWAALACSVSIAEMAGDDIVLTEHSAERHNDFGKHIYVVQSPAQNTREFLKILYIYEIGYVSSVCAVKFAILAFYRRIFPVQQLKLILQIATVVV
ncbi:hypothetical protein P7C71_g6415, partial [Lecanoromycetidae sp. Uapishka_2]